MTPPTDGITRRQFIASTAAAAIGLALPLRAGSTPDSDPYNAYRDGIVKRHILCSGRYLSELWLKEYEPGVDPPALLKYARVFTSPDLPPEQSAQRRVYVPWLAADGAIYGGGENPMLRGGIAMAAFAVEAMAGGQPSSLRYAELLLRYFEASEVRLANGEKTGFFVRCDHLRNLSGRLATSGGIGFHASMDEVSGLVLGLYYFHLAATDLEHRQRISNLAMRLGRNLKKSGFLLIGPGNMPVIQKGFAASYLFQWSLQQALQRITGERFEPTVDDYRRASDVLWEIYLHATDRIRCVDKLELLGIMYLWAKYHGLEAGQVQQWTSALQAGIAAEVRETDLYRLSFLSLLPGADAVAGKLATNVFSAVAAQVDLSSLGDPVFRYLASIWLEAESIYFYLWRQENWFNYTWALHTLHYALDEEVNRQNDSMAVAGRVAAAGHVMTKRILCGERYPRPQAWPPGYEVGTPDNDLYAAVIAKGLLSRFVPIGEARCSLIPFNPLRQSPYPARIDNALDARSRMWPELPAGEPKEVRDGKWPAPVRWHNSRTLVPGRAKVGTDFCWEHGPGDKKRIVATGAGVHAKATGMNQALLRRTLECGRDALFESGGLDYFFPRVLMGYWLKEPLAFTDPGVPPLKAVACLPSKSDGQYRSAVCTAGAASGAGHLLMDE